MTLNIQLLREDVREFVLSSCIGDGGAAGLRDDYFTGPIDTWPIKCTLVLFIAGVVLNYIVEFITLRIIDTTRQLPDVDGISAEAAAALECVFSLHPGEQQSEKPPPSIELASDIIESLLLLLLPSFGCSHLASFFFSFFSFSRAHSRQNPLLVTLSAAVDVSGTRTDIQAVAKSYNVGPKALSTFLIEVTRQYKRMEVRGFLVAGILTNAVLLPILTPASVMTAHLGFFILACALVAFFLPIPRGSGIARLPWFFYPTNVKKLQKGTAAS